MKLQSIKKLYGNRTVLKDFSFEIEEGKITSILGPSGCGKTTLLNIIAGLIPYEGEIIDGHEKISYVFQNQRLLPNLTVRQNLDFVIKSIIIDRQERKKMIENVLKDMELSDRIDDYASELSGGMAQRVSIARAFLYPSTLILMDEALKGLDIALKKKITREFLSLWEKGKKTVLAVSHDIDEALELSDRIIVLNSGGEIVFDEIISLPRQDLPDNVRIELKNKIYYLF